MNGGNGGVRGGRRDRGQVKIFFFSKFVPVRKKMEREQKGEKERRIDEV